MKIILDHKFTTEKCVVALGMFDGVHIGHRVLLERGAALARQKHVPLVVCTFQEHPLKVIAPEKCPPQLTTFEERNRLMEEMGVDVLCAMPFDRNVMDMPPEEYVGNLVRRFHPTDVVCGYNHTFGRKGQGTPALLEVLGGALGFSTSIVPNITFGDQEASSSAIRALLAKGNVELARKLLARPYEFGVISAERSGRACRLTLEKAGKQLLPAGDYRGFLCDEKHAWPVQIHFDADGNAVCALPASALLKGSMCLQLWCNLSIDF